jgi:hypothetical protein
MATAGNKEKIVKLVEKREEEAKRDQEARKREEEAMGQEERQH